MRKSNLFSAFVVFALLSVFLLFIFSLQFTQGFRGILELLFLPLQRVTYAASQTFGGSTPMQRLQDENASLRSQLAKQKSLEHEMQALKDQFTTAEPASYRLMPVHVVSQQSAFSGVTTPEELIIDKGKKDGLKKGMAVVVKNNLLGTISGLSEHVAVVQLVSNNASRLTAKTITTNASGVMKGKGGGSVFLDNVVASDTLKQDDTVVTKETGDKNAVTIPADLVIGKIRSIKKESSAVFQSAEIEPLVALSRLTSVFVIVQ